MSEQRRLKHIAEACIARMNGQELKSKGREKAAMHFMLGAAVGAHALADDNPDGEAGKLCDKVLLFCTLLLATRGWREVENLVKDKV